jgi:hypothetical protein
MDMFCCRRQLPVMLGMKFRMICPFVRMNEGINESIDPHDYKIVGWLSIAQFHDFRSSRFTVGCEEFFLPTSITSAESVRKPCPSLGVNGSSYVMKVQC